MELGYLDTAAFSVGTVCTIVNRALVMGYGLLLFDIIWWWTVRGGLFPYRHPLQI